MAFTPLRKRKKSLKKQQRKRRKCRLLAFSPLPTLFAFRWRNVHLYQPYIEKKVHKTMRKKKENPGDQSFFHFPNCSLYDQNSFFDSYSVCSAAPCSFDHYKNLFSVSVLTHCQTTNFRLFQIDRLCRRQFKIWRKWQKVIPAGEKHCGKGRNCLLRAISLFPTVFSKGFFPRGVKRRRCVGMGWRI